jgi:hypothetical protein
MTFNPQGADDGFILSAHTTWCPIWARHVPATRPTWPQPITEIRDGKLLPDKHVRDQSIELRALNGTSPNVKSVSQGIKTG